MAVIGQAEVDIKFNMDNTGLHRIQDEVKGATKQLGGFGTVADRVEGSLKKLGLTSQDLAVIMGAGLAGGAAFAVREVLRFGAASIEAASALEEQQAASDAVFDGNNKLVESFAESAAAIGLSERAALKATTTFGGFFQNIGVGAEEAEKLAVGFTALSADAGSLFDIEPELAAERIISGLRGEQDAVERLNVSINEKAVLDRAMADSGKESAAEITNGERVMARAKIIFEQLNVAAGNYALTAEGLANTQRTANAEWENAKAALGDALQPAAIAVTNALTDQLEALRALNDGYDSTETAVTFLGFGFRKMIDGKETNALQKLRDIVFGFDETAGDAADTSDELAGTLEALDAPMSKLGDTTDETTDEVNKLSDATTRLNRAIGDSERRVNRAEITLARAFEDAELRVDAAERGLAEAFEDRSQRIADAEARLIDERLDGFRSVRGAREKLADFERDSARRVVDAEQQILDLRRAQTRAIVNSLIDLERAQASGDAEAQNRARIALREAQDNNNIADAKRDLAQEESDRARERTRLERDLAEERIDAAKAIERSQLDLARTVDDTSEQIEEAQRRLTDAHRDSARSIADAQRGLADAFREGRESVDDATKALERLGDAAETAEKKVDKLLGTTESLRRILLAPAGEGPEGKVQVDNDLEDILKGLLRQHGGPVRGGGAYIVGEAGPELIVPQTSGTVVSNDQLLKALSDMTSGRSGGSAGASVVVNVPHQDPRVLANELAWRLVQDVNR